MRRVATGAELSPHRRRRGGSDDLPAGRSPQQHRRRRETGERGKACWAGRLAQAARGAERKRNRRLERERERGARTEDGGRGGGGRLPRRGMGTGGGCPRRRPVRFWRDREQGRGRGREETGEREELEASYWRGSGGLEVSRNHEHGGTDDNVVNREHHQIWTSKPRSNDRNEFC
jgi:hypothetical protein